MWMLRLDDHPAVPVIGHDVEGPEVEHLDSRKPDVRWCQVDGHGHTHRWATVHIDGKDQVELLTATRTAFTVECDGSCGLNDGAGCEGYTGIRWNCDRCGDEIEPEYVAATVTVVTSPARHVFHLDGSPFGDTSTYSVRNEPHRAVLRDVQTQTERAGRAWPTGSVEVSMSGVRCSVQMVFDEHATLS